MLWRRARRKPTGRASDSSVAGSSSSCVEPTGPQMYLRVGVKEWGREGRCSGRTLHTERDGMVRENGCVIICMMLTDVSSKAKNVQLDNKDQSLPVSLRFRTELKILGGFLGGQRAILFFIP